MLENCPEGGLDLNQGTAGPHVESRVLHQYQELMKGVRDGLT